MNETLLDARGRPRVVITGLGMVSPLGHSVEESWANLLAGVSGIGRITQFDPSPFATQVAGEVKDFNPRDHMDFKEARRMSRASQPVSYTHLDVYKRQALTWGLWIFLLLTFGRVHARPLEDITPLDPRRRALALFTLALFFLCFVPLPLVAAPRPARPAPPPSR